MGAALRAAPRSHGAARPDGSGTSPARPALPQALTGPDALLAPHIPPRRTPGPAQGRDLSARTASPQSASPVPALALSSAPPATQGREILTQRGLAAQRAGQAAGPPAAAL